jgi:murein endopeptidase
MIFARITFSWSVLFLGSAMFSSLLLTSACSSKLTSSVHSYKAPYVYSDPRSGDAVPMRVADETGTTKTIDEKDQLSFDNVTVQIKNSLVTVNLDKTVKANSEHIILTGSLDQDLSAHLDDSEPVAGESRMKGYLKCIGDVCAELYVTVYFYLDGEQTSRQLNVRNIDNDLKAALESAHADAEATTVVIDKTTTASGMIVTKDSDGSVTSIPAEDFEVNHGTEEMLADTGNGTWVTPEPDEKFLQNLKPDVPPSKVKVKPKQTPTTIYATPSSVSVYSEPFDFSNLILSGGGNAVNSADKGSISQSGTIMPTEGPGFRRVSPDRKAHGTGYSVSFMQEAAANYTKMHPECGIVTVRNISMAKGGPLYFDHPVNGQTRAASHQNGLDFDLAYLPLTDLRLVVHNKKLDSDFSMACNYNWFKYLANLNMPDTGEPFINVILVHTVVKNGLCKYQKDNGLNSPEDIQMQSVVYKTGDAHDDHAHVRLNCSHKHNECYNGSIDPKNVKCP